MGRLFPPYVRQRRQLVQVWTMQRVLGSHQQLHEAQLKPVESQGHNFFVILIAESKISEESIRGRLSAQEVAD